MAGSTLRGDPEQEEERREEALEDDSVEVSSGIIILSGGGSSLEGPFIASLDPHLTGECFACEIHSGPSFARPGDFDEENKSTRKSEVEVKESMNPTFLLEYEPHETERHWARLASQPDGSLLVQIFIQQDSEAEISFQVKLKSGVH